MSELSDDQLWLRAAGGDAAAFGAIYERHDRAVLAYLLWRTGDAGSAEDLAQVVFLEAWRGRGRLVLGASSARPLLLGIAQNVARSQWRARRRHRAALDRIAGQIAPHEIAGDDRALDRLEAVERLGRLRAQLAALPLREREVLALTALADLTYEETAALLSLPVGTVRSRLARARGRLREDAAPPGPPGAATADPIQPLSTAETIR